MSALRRRLRLAILRRMRVLVVEDEVKLAKLIRQGLRESGLLADVAVTGEDALWMAPANGYDVIVLDVNLPKIDGFETCRRLREDGLRTPILMLTARDGVADRVTGLDTGADDYLVKPFDFDELLARLRALAGAGRSSATRSSRSATWCSTRPAGRCAARARRSSCRPRSSSSSRCSCAGRARCSPASS